MGHLFGRPSFGWRQARLRRSAIHWPIARPCAAPHPYPPPEKAGLCGALILADTAIIMALLLFLTLPPLAVALVLDWLRWRSLRSSPTSLALARPTAAAPETVAVT